MTDLPLLSRPPAAAAPTGAAAPVRELDIAASGLDARERAVLVSLARLLDGRGGLRLRWVEDIADCNTLFVPHGWTGYLPPPRVLVRVVPPGVVPASSPPGLVVEAPLRMSRVTQVLDAAADRVDVADTAGGSGEGPHALHAALLAGLLSGERRRTLLPLGDGPGLIVDYPAGQLLSPWPLEGLLQTRLCLGPPQRAPLNPPWASALQPLRLPPLLWALGHRLSDAGRVPRAVAGRYVLRRWPEAAALARPQMPRLVAAWTRRPMTVAEAAAASQRPMAEIGWFLTNALALGIAVPAAEDAVPPPAASASAAASAAPATGSRSLFDRLRDRFKLW